MISNLDNSLPEMIEMIDAKDLETVIADARGRQTIEASVVETGMSMPILLAETTEIESARTDTQAVRDEAAIANGTEIEAHLDVMPAVTTTTDRTDEIAIHMMIAVVEDETVARMGLQDKRAVAAQPLHQRSENLPPT